MISRRRIISRSHEVLSDSNPYEFDENFWNSKEKLFKDHIQEILNKWEQIDDEIWAKIIVMEKNRRVAKAYARAQVLSINGSELGFDGYRIGLNGFQNPQRDSHTEDVKKHIGPGAKIKIDDSGNILIKRIDKCNIFVTTATNTRISDISHSNSKTNCVTMTAIQFEKSFKLFDMKSFQTNVCREIKNSNYPDRRKLEMECISCIAFVKEETNILEHPIWIMLINIVGLDMLKSKFPAMAPMPKFITIFEDTNVEKMLSNANKFSDRYATQLSNSNKDSTNSTLLSSSSSFSSSALSSRTDPTKGLSENENLLPISYRNRGLDDLYYCGLQARVPNYGRQRSSLAICANNSNLDLRRYFNSSLQLSSHASQPNTTFDDNLESLDMYGRESESYNRRKPSEHCRNSFDNHISQQQQKQKNVSQNRRTFTQNNWKEF